MALKLHKEQIETLLLKLGFKQYTWINTGQNPFGGTYGHQQDGFVVRPVSDYEFLIDFKLGVGAIGKTILQVEREEHTHREQLALAFKDMGFTAFNTNNELRIGSHHMKDQDLG